MSLIELEEKREAAIKSSKKIYEYLKFLELNNIHRPRDVVEFGTKALKLRLLPDQNRWRLAERVSMSALDLGDTKLARIYIKELSDEFNSNSSDGGSRKVSKRVTVLKSMFYEAQAQYDRARTDYLNPVLSDDAVHKSSLKRKIAISLEQRDRKLAIRQLNDYLSVHSSDEQAWKLVYDLHMAEHNYELAKFALEELIVMKSNDYLLHLLLAELIYNMAGDNPLLYQISLKYFSQSLLLSGDSNIRALYGILFCLRRVFECNNHSLKKFTDSDMILIRKSMEKIMRVYTKSKSSLLSITKETLLDLNLQE